MIKWVAYHLGPSQPRVSYHTSRTHINVWYTGINRGFLRYCSMRVKSHSSQGSPVIFGTIP